MIIRRALIFAALLALGVAAAFAQAQNAVYYAGETNTQQSPEGSHQLPSSSGCTLPTNTLNPAPTCVIQGQSYNLATMEVIFNGAAPGVAPTWAVTSGKLPTGLSLNAGPTLDSQITGTPTAAGVYSFVITATLSGQTNIASITYTMAVGTGTTPDLPVITPTALPAPSAGATAGSPLPQNWYTAAATLGYPCVTPSTFCTANNPTFTPYYNWSIQGGTVDGLSINSTTGAFTGTPLSGGTFSLTLQAIDGLNQPATWATTVTIGGPSNFLITTSSLPSGVVGTAYTPTVTTQGGLTPITFTRVSGNLPPGVADCTPSGINCVFSGTPSVAGTYNFSLQASYTANSTTVNSNIQPYAVVIAQQSGSTLALPSPASQSVALGQSASMTFAATGGTPPYTYNTAPLFTGPFPPGLTMNATTGVLSGTTSQVGTYSFTVEVTDHTGAEASAQASMAVGNTLSLPIPTSQTVTIGQAVSMQFTASGGTGSYAYTLISGGFPPNLSLNGTTGLVSGNISSSATGTYTFTIKVTDSSSNTATAQTSITVNSTSSLTLPTPASQTVTVGQSTSMQFTATGGTGTGYSYTLASGSLPPGLSLSGTTGLVSGTPTTANVYTFAVSVTDSASNAATSGATSITVGASSTTLALPTPTSQTVTVGQNVSVQFTATGGTAPYTYTLASGSLPPGTSLAGSTGAISGAPTASGTYTFAVKVTDSASNTVTSGSTSITANAALTMASPAAVTGVNNNSLTIQFTAAGGTAPYTYSITGVTLNGNTISIPSQLTINSSSGLVTFATTTATASGPYAITVKATDAASNTVSAAGTITVGAALTLATPPAITNAVVGQSVSMQFTATGGTPPYTYAFVSGVLPPGLNLNTSTGLVSGVPTQANSSGYAFIIQVTDSATPPLTATAQGTIIPTNLSLTGSNVSINITNSTGTNLNGTAIPADTQPNVTVSIGSPLSQNIQGTIGVSLKRTFDSAASNEVSFPAGQQVNFQIPAGSTTAVFGSSPSTQLKVGTAAGSGQIQAIFQDSLGNNITPQNLQNVQFSVAPAAPVINCPSPCGFTISGPTPSSGTTPGGQYVVTIIGYSTTLNMTGVSFTFTPTTGTNVASTTVTVPLTNSSGQNVFANWFGNSQSNQYGGQFTLQVPLNFTVSGGSQSNPIAGATVTLTNSQGTFTSGTVIPSTQ